MFYFERKDQYKKKNEKINKKHFSKCISFVQSDSCILDDFQGCETDFCPLYATQYESVNVKIKLMEIDIWCTN